jgi:uncharacterized protein
MALQNPFMFDRPLEDGRDLVGRERELAELGEAMEKGRDVLVDGPHRHGKTSLVNGAFRAWGDGQPGLAVHVDCAGLLTIPDLLYRLDDAFVRTRVAGQAEEVLVERMETLTFRFAGGKTGTPRTEAGIGIDLDDLLHVPGDVAALADARAVICFDDFQDALALRGVADAVARAREREEEGRVAYVFSGSGLASLAEKRAERPAWEKGPARVYAGHVEAELFADHISRKFEETGRDAGEAAQIVATAGAGHPQRTNLLAWQLWQLTGPGGRASVASARMAIELAVQQIAPEFEVRWQALHGNERRVAVAIANEIAPQGTRAQRATGLAGYGAAQRAVQGVKASGIAELRDERMTLTDPLFAEWLRQRHAALPPEPDWGARRREAARHVGRGIGR